MKKYRVNEIIVPIGFSNENVLRMLTKRLMLSRQMILDWKISKKSVDARKKSDIKYILSVDVTLGDNVVVKDKKTSVIVDKPYVIPPSKKLNSRPVIVGFGPAGMFAALILAEDGHQPIVLERGNSVEQRQKDTENFFKRKIFNEESNVQFGEGGAGTFSDGKLNTGTKDVRIKKVFDEFVLAGAPESILTEAKPHIGTDNLPTVVKNIREKIKSLGGEIYFETKMTDIIVENDKIKGVKAVNKTGEMEIATDNLIIALGHSARDSFNMLYDNKVFMEQKAFAVGVRIEHKAEMINKSQYQNFHDKLPTADYKLFTHLTNGRGVYTFCMCPGGDVVAATSMKNAVVTNGMSNYKRDGKNSNAGVLVGVTQKDFGSEHVLAGMKFQEKLEQKAFVIGGSNYDLPCQRYEDFVNGKVTERFGQIKPSNTSRVSKCDINAIFADEINTSIKLGIKEFGKRLRGFDMADALLTAPETRSSSPVRITRGDNMMSLNIKGLYPCGEGAGYAGGITSAAVDGIKVAEAIIVKK